MQFTDALVELGANVHAFVRPASSGGLNSIRHLRGRPKVHFADLTDRTPVDYLIRELRESATARPTSSRLGAQAHVTEVVAPLLRGCDGECGRQLNLLNLLGSGPRNDLLRCHAADWLNSRAQAVSS